MFRREEGFSVSVIIPTIGRDTLDRCVTVLGDQDCELVIFSDALKNGPYTVRNNGAKHAKRDIFGFTDDDCIPRKDWVDRAVQYFKKGFNYVSGKTIGRHKTNRQIMGSTCNMFCTRTLFKKLGGFDAKFRCMGDLDFFWRALKKKAKIVYASDVVVWHPSKPGLTNNRDAYSIRRLQRKHPKEYKRLVEKNEVWDDIPTTIRTLR